MVDEQPAAEAGCGVDVHRVDFADLALQGQRDDLLAAAPQRVADPVHLQRLEAFEVQERAAV